MQKVLNFWGGPGSGKSTLAAGTFAKLKCLGYNVELVREYAKELVWRDGMITKAQDAILAEQYGRQVDLRNKVDLIITDSPIWMSVMYGSGPHAKILHDTFECYEVFVERNKPYNPKGREQSEEEAILIDGKILELGVNFDLRVTGDALGIATTSVWISRILKG